MFTIHTYIIYYISYIKINYSLIHYRVGKAKSMQAHSPQNRAQNQRNHRSFKSCKKARAVGWILTVGTKTFVQPEAMYRTLGATFYTESKQLTVTRKAPKLAFVSGDVDSCGARPRRAHSVWFFEWNLGAAVANTICSLMGSKLLKLLKLYRPWLQKSPMAQKQ